MNRYQKRVNKRLKARYDSAMRGGNYSEAYRLAKIIMRNDAEEPASWITTENGHKVPLDKEGKALAGGGGTLKGKDFSGAKSESSSKSSGKSSGSTNSNKSSTVKITASSSSSGKKFVSNNAKRKSQCEKFSPQYGGIRGSNDKDMTMEGANEYWDDIESQFKSVAENLGIGVPSLKDDYSYYSDTIDELGDECCKAFGIKGTSVDDYVYYPSDEKVAETLTNDFKDEAMKAANKYYNELGKQTQKVADSLGLNIGKSASDTEFLRDMIDGIDFQTGKSSYEVAWAPRYFPSDDEIAKSLKEDL